jgi:hypothetical protein
MEDVMHHGSRALRLLLVTLIAGCQPAAEPTGTGGQSPTPTTPTAGSAAANVDQPAPATTPFVCEAGFQLINFDQMAVFPTDGSAAQTWTAEGDEFLCTGKPKCYLHTKTPYGNGTLRFDYKFEPDPKITDPAKLAGHNTGVLLFIQEPHAVWPKSIEVQGKHSEMGQLRPNGGAVAVEFQDSPDVRESARKPVGEWNAVEIVTKAGAITASINGQVVAVGQPGELTRGLIGLQAEGHRLRYRHLRFAPAQ